MPAPIKIEGLSKTFRVGFWGRKFEAVNDLFFEVREGELIGLIGPNGAGKTTTIKLLLGLLLPTRGNAWIFGKKAGDVLTRTMVGYLPEIPYFYEHLNGREFLDFYGRLFPIARVKRREKVDRLLELVGLSCVSGLPLRKYSRGMLQRIGLAQALINDPRLVVLDEPMTGLDPVGRREIRDIILGLKREGKTVFFSTHILADIEMICDGVGIMHRGRLITAGSLSELLNPRVKYYEISFSGIAGEKIKKGSFQSIKTYQDGNLIFTVVPDEREKDKLINWIHTEGGNINSVVPHRESLEEYFVQQVDAKAPDGEIKHFVEGEIGISEQRNRTTE